MANSLPTAHDDAISRFGLSRRPLMLLLTALLTLASLAGAGLLTFNDDPTDYLPTDNHLVGEWVELTRRFGALDLLMIGLEEPEKPLSFDGLVAVARVTDALNERKAQGVHYVRSLTNVDTLLPTGDGELKNELLVPAIPRTQEEKDRLMLRILADTQVPGSFVSHNLMGYSIMVRVDERNDMAQMARLVMDIVEENRGPLKAYYFGAPFISHQITSSVFGKLPWVIPLFALLLLGIVWLRLRNIVVMGLLLGLIGLPLLWWLGLLALTGTVLSTTGMNAALLILPISLVVFSRGAERWLSRGGPVFTGRTFMILIASALALGALTESPISFLVQFGQAGSIGILAVALVGLVTAPALVSLLKPGSIPHEEQPAAAALPRRPLAWVSVALVAIGLLAAFQLRFIVNPPDIFSKTDRVGAALSFFDRHFGGSDFLQISVRGDLRDPPVLARVMALTDLLEGQKAFADVRSITQVAGFLAGNFAGTHRIPPQREALDNLYFFLEGNEDVRSLITEQRDEAMLAIRVPPPSEENPDWVELVRDAINRSTTDNPTLATRRLRALADRFRLTVTDSQIEESVRKAREEATTLNARVARGALKTLSVYMQSDESPLAPTDEEWDSFADILKESESDRLARLRATIAGTASFKEAELPGELADELADMLVTRFDDAVLRERASLAVAALVNEVQFSSVPRAFITRAEGIMADLMEDRLFAPDLDVHISGLPAILDVVEGSLKVTMLWAILVLWGLMSVFAFVIVRKRRPVLRASLEAALATLLVLALGWLFGIQIDSASATLYLLPPVLAFLMSPWLGASDTRSPQPSLFPVTFAAALAAAALTLLLTDVLPVMRLGAVLANALAITAAVGLISRRTPLESRTE